MPNPLLIPLMRWLGRLSYPKLFLFASALFVVSLVVPDPVPLVEELLLGLGALLLARRKRKPADADARSSIDGEARRG